MTPWKEYGRYGTVGIELIVMMALGYYGGRYLDARLGAHGWLTLAGFLFGLVVGFRGIFEAGRHMMRDIERAEKADRGEDPWANDGAEGPKDNARREVSRSRDDGEPGTTEETDGDRTGKKGADA